MATGCVSVASHNGCVVNGQAMLFPSDSEPAAVPGGVAFQVAGVPAPQGSKTPWGTEANPRTRPWRAAVSAAAAEAMGTRPAILDPVTVDVLFVFPRPKSHYRTGRHAGVLRDDAPLWHAQAPDADKLQRAIGDSLTGIVVRDDKQVSRWVSEKRYGERAGCRISVTPLV